jgi:hypothetical protein
MKKNKSKKRLTKNQKQYQKEIERITKLVSELENVGLFLSKQRKKDLFTHQGIIRKNLLNKLKNYTSESLLKELQNKNKIKINENIFKNNLPKLSDKINEFILDILDNYIGGWSMINADIDYKNKKLEIAYLLRNTYEKIKKEIGEENLYRNAIENQDELTKIVYRMLYESEQDYLEFDFLRFITLLYGNEHKLIQDERMEFNEQIQDVINGYSR